MGFSSVEYHYIPSRHTYIGQGYSLIGKLDYIFCRFSVIMSTSAWGRHIAFDRDVCLSITNSCPLCNTSYQPGTNVHHITAMCSAHLPLTSAQRQCRTLVSSHNYSILLGTIYGDRGRHFCVRYSHLVIIITYVFLLLEAKTE